MVIRYVFFAVMKEKQWLDMLPVICISSETSEDSIRRVYGLGASDYFSRPFDAMTVFHRVESTIALHDKMTGAPAGCDENVIIYFSQDTQD